MRTDGYTVLTAHTGAKGFEIACQEIPSLVILDLGLPDMPGLEVCNQLRRQRTTATIPIIMLTAKYHEIDKVVGLEVGADAERMIEDHQRGVYVSLQAGL